MKAVIISQPGGPEVLRLSEVDEPRPASTEIKVDVHATALNRADLLQRMGSYPAPYGIRQDIPGLECSGVIEELGADVVGFAVGERVMGLLSGEGYAEKVTLDYRLAMKIPDIISFAEAAAIPEAFVTAHDAFRQLSLCENETLLVHAIGSGVGLAALQVAKSMNVTVFGTAGSQEKLEKAAGFGLDFGINYREQAFDEIIRKNTQDGGVNAILDLVGASNWTKNLDCLTEQGRMIIVGLVGGARVEANLAAILRKRLKIIGTVLRPRSVEQKAEAVHAFKNTILPLFEQAVCQPVIDRTFPLSEAAAAHEYMQKNLNCGKIVLTVREDP